MPRPNVHEVDVLDLTDLRLEGGTASSVAEEITAQAAAGYTTAVRHVDSPLQARTSPLNPRVRNCIEQGRSRLTLPHEAVVAKVAIVRHPAVLQHATSGLENVEADRVAVVANAAPRDIDGYRHYDPDAVLEASLRWFGTEPHWAPIGPLVRESISALIGAQRVLDDDWVNIIDVDWWSAHRDQFVGSRPVIGRHSRDNRQKWPADPSTLRAVYPADGSVDVRVLGGASAVRGILGEIPDTWDVLPFGSVSPREFLAGVDFFVYFHNPNWVEAFGRTILEALASGAVAILPEHFRVLFGDAACYTTPRAVQHLVRELYDDRSAYEAQVERGWRTARRRFGHEAHVSRLADLIGQPSRGQATGSAASGASPDSRDSKIHTAVASRRPAELSAIRRDRSRQSVLLVSSNGSGMGHLTRLLAYAEHLPEHMDAHFLSLSQAVPAVRSFGYTYEYLPSMDATGLLPTRWHDYFAARVSEVIERLRPSVVVFDGTVPYERLPDVRKMHPDVPWVWSRRGMWYRGRNRDQLVKAAWFDVVIEPGELAAPADKGVTSQAPSTRVRPVTVLDFKDLDERQVARRALGLDDDRPAALVTLGAGNINDPSSDIRVVLEALKSRGVQVCVTRPAIAEQYHQAFANDVDVHVVNEFPLSRRYRAFDVAVSAAGYNSVHELLRFGVPTLFLPNLETALDDQCTRAEYVAGEGWAHSAEKPDPTEIGKLLDDLLTRGSEMVAAAAAADPGNGAVDAMACILATADAAKGAR